MRAPSHVAVTATILALTACGGDHLHSDDSDTEAASIHAASVAFSDAYVRGDTAAIGDLYTEAAVLLPPGRRIEGREAIKAYFAPSSNRRIISHSMTSSELTIEGDLAVDIGTWSNSWQLGGHEVEAASEAYLVVWEKGADGRWRIRYDMWHRSAG